MRFNLIILFFLIQFSAKAFSSPDSIQTTCYRNLTIYSDKILVQIQIEKPSLSGFARIYEKLPPDAIVGKISAGKSVYKNEKSMLKFVWDEIPTDQILEITYEIKLKKPLSDTLNSFIGTFTAEFLPENINQISIQSGKLDYQNKIPPEIAKNEVKITEIKSTENTKTETQPLASADGTYFCIQVAAVGKNIPSDYLKKQHGFEGEFESHYEENIYRITVGKFKSYTEAEAVLKEYKEKYFKKCFLSAYKDGKKIPLYEAQKLLN